MGILESAKPIVVICTRDRVRAVKFYRDTLGLELTVEEDFSAVFEVSGTTLRVSTVAGFTALEHTILGFKVPDVIRTVKELSERGITFNIYPGFPQDELGILTVPGTTTHVAWIQDPDGNVLSITDA